MNDSHHLNVKQLPETVERPVGWMQLGPVCLQNAPGNIIMSSSAGQTEMKLSPVTFIYTCNHN